MHEDWVIPKAWTLCALMNEGLECEDTKIDTKAEDSEQGDILKIERSVELTRPDCPAQMSRIFEARPCILGHARALALDCPGLIQAALDTPIYLGRSQFPAIPGGCLGYGDQSSLNNTMTPWLVLLFDGENTGQCHHA